MIRLSRTWISLIAALAAIASCSAQETKPSQETVPVQKAQAPTVKDAKHQGDLDNDRKMGETYSKEVEKEFKFSKNEEYIARVDRIGQQFAEIANRKLVTVTWGDKRLNPFLYTFKVIEGEDVNAFSLPGGYIYVHEGLLRFAQSDDELAGVLAHEVAHASLRHVATLQREQNKLQAVTIPLILATILGAGGAETASGLGQLAGLIGLAKTSGWSVSAEEAADYAGMQYMTESAFEASAMLTFMERLHQKSNVLDSIDWGIYRTHPPTSQRVRALMSHMAEMGRPIRRSLASSGYRTSIIEGPNGFELKYDNVAIHVFGGPDGKQRGEYAAKAMDAFLDRVPNLYEVRLIGTRVYGADRFLFEAANADLQGAVTPQAALNAVRRVVSAARLKVWIAD